MDPKDRSKKRKTTQTEELRVEELVPQFEQQLSQLQQEKRQQLEEERLARESVEDEALNISIPVEYQENLPYNYNDKLALVCLFTVAAANATIMSLV